MPILRGAWNVTRCPTLYNEVHFTLFYGGGGGFLQERNSVVNQRLPACLQFINHSRYRKNKLPGTRSSVSIACYKSQFRPFLCNLIGSPFNRYLHRAIGINKYR
jgi:hypothetical protein